MGVKVVFCRRFDYIYPNPLPYFIRTGFRIEGAKFVSDKDSAIKPKSIYLVGQQKGTVLLWTLDSAQGSAEDSPRLCVNKPIEYIHPQTFTDFSTSSNLRFLQWNPQSLKLGLLDESGVNLCFRNLQPNSKAEVECHDLTTIADTDLSPNQSLQATAVCCSFSCHSGRYLSIARSNGSVWIFDFRNHLALRASFTSNQLCSNCPYNHKHTPVCLTWALVDRVVVCGCDDGCIILFLAALGKTESDVVSSCLPYPAKKPVSIGTKFPACTQLRNSRVDTSLIASGYEDGSICVWKLEWPINNYADCLITQWHPNDFARSSENTCLKHMNLVLSPVNDQLLLSSGFPDLCLRLWNISSTTKKPVKELVPKITSQGYLTIDLAPDSFTLATGLINGEVWIYDLRNLSAPIYLLNGKPGIPVLYLGFAQSNKSHDEVRFKDSLNCIDYSIKPKSNPESIKEKSPKSCRSMLGELSNLSEDFQNQRSWNSLLREFSVPELSSVSSSSVFSPIGKSVQFATPLSEPVTSNQNPSEITNQSYGLEVGPKTKPKSGSPTLPELTRTKTEKPVTTETQQSIHTNQIDDLVKQTVRRQLEPLIFQSHHELLFHISKLERRIEQMRTEFLESIRELKQNNLSLRLELMKYCSFY